MNLLRFRQGAKVLGHREQLDRFERAGVFLQDRGRARTQRVFGGNFLCFVRIQIVQIGLGEFPGALLGHRAFHDGHRVLCHDADRWVHRVDLAGAKLAVHRNYLGLKSHQHVADIALQKDGGGVAPTLGQHRHVLEQLADKLGGLRIRAALLAHIAPGRKIGHAAVAAGLGVDDDDLDARFDQIVPVLDVFRVALTRQKQHGRAGR